MKMFQNAKHGAWSSGCTGRLVLIPCVWAMMCLTLCASSCQKTSNKTTLGVLHHSVDGEDGGAIIDAGAKGKASIKSTPTLPKDGTIKPVDVGPKAAALFMISGLKGYTEPCGCTADIVLGGIDRIVGYVGAAKKLHPYSVMLDGGDLLFEEPVLAEHRKLQEKRKANLLMDAHRKLGTKYTVPGHNDFALGTVFYLDMLKKGGITPLGANLKIDGQAIDATAVVALGRLRVGLIGVIASDAYGKQKRAGLSIEEPYGPVKQAIEKLRADQVDVIVALAYGTSLDAKALLLRHKGLDFVLAGKKPKMTDEVVQFGKGHILEVYDQGRYLGILKLYKGGEHAERPLFNARPLSKSEIEAIDKRISYLDDKIKNLLPTSLMVGNFRAQLKKLKSDKIKAKNAKVRVPAGKSAFIYRTIAMEPGLPVDAEVTKWRKDYNKELKNISKLIRVAIPEPISGQAFYVGTNNCKTCHAPAYAFWEKTDHAHAVATLSARDKDFDQACIGCHVVGYEQPGGSVLNGLEYAFKLNDVEYTKDLRNVGCESCHGPGSKHMNSPVGDHGKPAHIIRAVDEKTCMGSCHVPEHSERFNFKTYVELITGQGHGAK